LAGKVGLSADVLARFGAGWSVEHEAYTFAVKGAGGGIIGIHLRLPSGRKLAVKGLRQGLFIPDAAPAPGGQMLIGEGMTDAAALVQLGFPAMGRPSCSGATKLVCEYYQRHESTDVVIVADVDEPGQRGASNLASVLLCYVPTIRVITPRVGSMDARAWLAAGATADAVRAAIDAAPARSLTVTRKAVDRGR
jgi:hypothetical protein